MSESSDRPEGAPLFDPEAWQMCSSVGYLLSRAKIALTNDVEQEAAALDITHAQATCLMMLANDRARTVTDLGREMNTDMGSVTRLVSRMEKRGLVKRERSEVDRRIVELSITPAGHAVMQQLPALFCRVLNRRFRDFTPDEIDVLRGMLQRVLANNSG
ncbi:DNA-binding MarR family transcriptional regulator [Cupriavidus gilardii J11]|uniref:DNA-binding MarR family transcriptional regulator n=1 Tax=Cupriavidus gilardii J11 TaxID=936133 RepID=A0A562B3D0_9BURK|nr:MarR family transcriptional regulator [Cupriavidus gilardii]TWG79623.1 DNA-binding MarR family transcriptional regulator [Cupriavidus gilardii J11]